MKFANGKTFLSSSARAACSKCKADGKGGQTIEDTGPLTKKRMETIDDEDVAAAKDFITRRTRRASPSSAGGTARACTSART
jgi:hypothetical protein